MKKIILLCCISLAVLTGYSQNNSQSDATLNKKSVKQQKAEMKEADEKATAKMVQTMLTNRQFILEVESMNDQATNFLNTGGWISVSQMGNYIAVNSDKIVLQFESNENQTSNWPFGKVPNNDTFSKYVINKPQKSGDSYNISFRTNGKIGPYDITMNTSSTGKTQLTMKNNLGLSLNLKGVLVPLKKSKINPVFI